MEHSVEEIARKMDELGLWQAVAPYNWAIKPLGTVFPYFCTTMPGDSKPVKVRFLLLEGWQTLHDFVRTRADNSFGFFSSPMEFPHLELVVLADGDAKFFRHDTGYMPVEANERQRALGARLLWEAYGFLLRFESDPQLAMRYAEDRAVFARVETKPGTWEDRPLVIPNPPPHVEKVSFDKTDVKLAQDLPFVADETLHVSFALEPRLMTKDPRPRSVYRLVAYDPAAKALAIDLQTSVAADGGLRQMWETMPPQLLKSLIKRGRIPGSIKVSSARVFRMLRPLCMELPFKLSLHDKLEFP